MRSLTGGQNHTSYGQGNRGLARPRDGNTAEGWREVPRSLRFREGTAFCTTPVYCISFGLQARVPNPSWVSVFKAAFTVRHEQFRGCSRYHPSLCPLCLLVLSQVIELWSVAIVATPLSSMHANRKDSFCYVRLFPYRGLGVVVQRGLFPEIP